MTTSDRALAAGLRKIARICGFSPASIARKLTRFRIGRIEHGDNLAALDLVGEAGEEVDDAFCYLALEFLLHPRPRPELIIALEAVRAAEEAVEACRIPPPPL